MEILSGKIVRVRRTGPKHGYSHHIEIYAKDLANDKRIKISNVRYGDLPFTIHAFGKTLLSNHKTDLKKYPAGARVVGYKDPNSDKYVLERGNILAPIAVLSLAALWLLGNVFIMIRYPKNRKKKQRERFIFAEQLKNLKHLKRLRLQFAQK